MKSLKCILSVLLLVFILAGCFESATFYNLGGGFKYGFYNNNKQTYNVFYHDQGIVRGVCYEVRWNDEYILMKSYLFIDGGRLKDEADFYLIDKKLYSKNPIQTESKAVVGPLSEADANILIGTKNILFNNIKTKAR